MLAKVGCGMPVEHELECNQAIASDLSSVAFDDADLAIDPTSAAAPGHLPQAADHGCIALMEACAADLKEALQAGDTERIPPLVKAVADFALIQRGAIRPGSRRAQQTFRIGRLSMARRLIERHLSKPALSPAMVAGLLGVSVRYVHVLFEATGDSFSQIVAAERLRHARRLLLRTPPLTVAEIANACGFGSLATFYRVFGASVGLTPGEFRAQAATNPFVGAVARGPRGI
jgi:AraC-like DNA-binding protein